VGQRVVEHAAKVVLRSRERSERSAKEDSPFLS
jgi:hypothetical protein